MGNTCSSCIQAVEANTTTSDGDHQHRGRGVGNSASGSNAMESGGGHQLMMQQQPCVDPLIYDLVRRTFPQPNYKGQYHLLYHKMKRGSHLHSTTTSVTTTTTTTETNVYDYSSDTYPVDHHSSPTKKKTQTRLILRRRGGSSGTTATSSTTATTPTTTSSHQETHIYAIRYPKELLSAEQLTDDDSDGGPGIPSLAVEAAPRSLTSMSGGANSGSGGGSNNAGGMGRPESKPDDPYSPSNMRPKPPKNVKDWVCVSEELDIYVCDTGLSFEECNALVATTEQACKGHYAAYTYAKQTLGCREYPTLAQACFPPVHRVTHAILEHATAGASKKSTTTSKTTDGTITTSTTDNATTTQSKSSTTTSAIDPSIYSQFQLDDREPHIVKYDISKKERQKLDMHTDKSEWTFLISLSDGCGLDYEGGGTFFEALNATVHVQRGHALIFPGRLRHCGQRINKGLRFLLVGFLVDKKVVSNANNNNQGQQQTQQQQQQQQVTNSSTTTTSSTSIPAGAAAKAAGTTADYTTVSFAELNKAKSLVGGSSGGSGGGVVLSSSPWTSDDMISREA